MFPPKTDLTILRPAIATLLKAGPEPDAAAIEAFLRGVHNATDSNKTGQLVIDLFLEPDPAKPSGYRLTEAAKGQLPDRT